MLVLGCGNDGVAGSGDRGVSTGGAGSGTGGDASGTGGAGNGWGGAGGSVTAIAGNGGDGGDASNGDATNGGASSSASNGDATAGKLVAARRLGLPVIMVERPPKPDVETVAHVDQVLPWLVAQGLFVTERGV